jgi:hypothetical protein
MQSRDVANTAIHGGAAAVNEKITGRGSAPVE